MQSIKTMRSVNGLFQLFIADLHLTKSLNMEVKVITDNSIKSLLGLAYLDIVDIVKLFLV